MIRQWAVFLLYLLTVYQPLKAKVELLDTEVLQTPKGQLSIQPYRKGKPVEWGVYRRYREGDEFRLDLNGSLVTKFSVDRWAGVKFEAAYPNEQNARLVLISFWPGGNACNGYYRVLEIVESGKPVISEEFGNCLSIAFSKHYKLNENPVYRDGVWNIALESHSGNKVLDWWIYKDGIVKQAGGPDLDIAKWPKEQQRYMLQFKMRLSRKEYMALLEQYGSPEAAYYGWLKERIKKVEPASYQ